MWVCTVVGDNRFCSKSNVLFPQWFYNCGCSRAEWTSSYKRNPGQLTGNHINLRKSSADCTQRVKILWRKMKQVFSILTLHSYGPCWRPITDVVSLLWRLRNIHSPATLQTQLQQERLLYTASLMRKQKMVKIIHQKGTLCTPANALSSKLRQNATKITYLALGRMILKVFPQTGWGSQDGQSKSQCAKFRHYGGGRKCSSRSKTPNWPITYQWNNRE